jgi:hypothetical protein
MRKMNCNLVLFSLVAYLAMPGWNHHPAMAAEARTPEQILARAIQATAWRDKSHIVSSHHLVIRRSLDEVSEISGRTEMFQNGSSRRAIKYAQDETRLMDILIHVNRRVALIGEIAHYSEDPLFIEMSSGFDASPTREFGAFLDGVYLVRLWGPPLDLARAAAEGKVDDAVGEEKVQNLTCHVVTIRGETWSWKLWIAPERGYNLARQEISREPAPGERSVGTVDDVEFEFLEPTGWVVSRGRYSDTKTRAGGELASTLQVQRTRIDPDPDFDALGAFQLPAIPDGTTVIISEGNPAGGDPVRDPIRHVWKDGKPVPAYSPEAVERIRRRVEEVKRAREQ